MTARRFNYTGRKRILQNQVAITLHETDGDPAPTFTTELNLEGMELPAAARLLIVSQRDRAAMRFPWGTVGQPAPPADCRLLDTPINPYFRVMALDDAGRLLALADRIMPRRASRRESLLWLQEEDLGREVWRLDFGGQDSNPTLLVNRSIPGISMAVRQDNAFRALVIPEALRAILTRALIVDDEDPRDPDGGWTRWFGFVRTFYPEDTPESADDPDRDHTAMREWIDRAVAAFAARRFDASAMYAATVRP